MSQLFQVNGRWVTLEQYQAIRSDGGNVQAVKEEPLVKIPEKNLSKVESKPEDKPEDSIGKMLE